MCTVAFLPFKGKFHFASLRDESQLRKQALAPTIYNIEGIEVIAPLDGFAGGTWVGTNSLGNIIILLNGAFENHVRASSYRLSRGLIVKTLLQAEKPVSVWQLMDLHNIEPFTLIVWQQQKLYELVWDGLQKHWQKLAIHQPYIWSSSTLYNSDAKQQRKALFQQWWATQPMVNRQSMLHFFQSNIDIQNGFMIHRSATMKTLSFTFLTAADNILQLHYHDFLNATTVTQNITCKQFSEVF